MNTNRSSDELAGNLDRKPLAGRWHGNGAIAFALVALSFLLEVIAFVVFQRGLGAYGEWSLQIYYAMLLSALGGSCVCWTIALDLATKARKQTKAEQGGGSLLPTFLIVAASAIGMVNILSIMLLFFLSMIH